LTKEHIEIYSSGSTAILEDFKRLIIYGKGRLTKKKLMNQNKGQKEMLEAYFDNLLKDGSSAIPQKEIFSVMRATFRVVHSIENGGVQIEV